MCPSNARKVFIFLEKGHVKSVQELTDNLKNLLRQLKNDKAIIRSSLESNLTIVLSQTKLLEEKDRLRKLCHKEVQNLLKKKNEEPQTKKEKANEDALLDIPVVTSVDELLGKRAHLTYDYDGKEKWFPRVVVYQKPDSDTELVIRYDGEDKLYSFNFSDFNFSIIKLTSVTPTDILGKVIRQRLTNIENNDFWWEQGIVISRDLNSYLNLIINFFDNDEYDESDFSLNIYEVLVLSLIDDNLNHYVQFL